MIKGIDSLQAGAYSVYKIHNQQAEEIALKQNGAQNIPASQEVKPEDKGNDSLDLRLSDIRPRANASLEDISLSLNDPKPFEMKGSKSDLESLDIQKAVSDMQKDQALMQYQYFVGDTNIMGSEDGIVIPK